MEEVERKNAAPKEYYVPFGQRSKAIFSTSIRAKHAEFAFEKIMKVTKDIYRQRKQRKISLEFWTDLNLRSKWTLDICSLLFFFVFIILLLLLDRTLRCSY